MFVELEEVLFIAYELRHPILENEVVELLIVSAPLLHLARGICTDSWEMMKSYSSMGSSFIIDFGFLYTMCSSFISSFSFPGLG